MAKKSVNFDMTADDYNIYSKFTLICKEGRDIKILPKCRVTFKNIGAEI